MPIYRYECSSCKANLEIWAKVNDAPPETCDECGRQGTLTKLVARTAFHLKGGGWYAHGYGDSAGSDSKTVSPKDEAKTSADASDSAPAPASTPAATPTTTSDSGSSSSED